MERKTYTIDATGISFGRLCTQIATLLRGKTKISYVPYLDEGDFVIIENVDKVKVTGKKEKDKKYYSHSGYPGGLKTKAMKELSKEDVIKKAVTGMLPNNRLRNGMLKRLSFSN